MNNYIIKNCPNCYSYGEHDYWCEFEHDNTLFTNPCQKSDCLLKQIVGKCYKATHEDLVITADYNKTACEVTEIYGRAGLAQEILQLLEIEECENE